LQQHAITARRRRSQQPQHFIGTEYARQRLGPVAVRDQRQLLRPTERDAIEEAQGTDGLVEQAPGDLAAEEMELEGTNLLGTE
jgi:hypothetical protein